MKSVKVHNGEGPEGHRLITGVLDRGWGVRSVSGDSPALPHVQTGVDKVRLSHRRRSHRGLSYDPSGTLVARPAHFHQHTVAHRERERERERERKQKISSLFEE